MDEASILASLINRANQLNPNNWRFWTSRGFASRPQNWQELVGSSIPVISPWLGLLSPLHSAISLSKSTIRVLMKMFSYLDTTVIIIGTSIGLICWYYPVEAKNYLVKGCNGVSSICQSTSHFVTTNVGALVEVNNNIWNYGVVLPCKVAASGLVYACMGLGGLATRIGYYCEPQKPQKY